MDSASLINLDANATTAPLPEVIETVARHLRDTPGNPGSRHALGRQARRVLEDSRESLASILGAHPDELVFTSGGTESNTLAVQGLARGRSGQIVTTPGEHPTTREAATALVQRGWSRHELPVDTRGQLTTSGLDAVSWSSPPLVALLYAHNETGAILDLDDVRRRCEQSRAAWHLDAVQAVGKIPVDFHALGSTTLSFAAHKFHGPRGIGGLIVRRGTVLSPVLFGGHQEQGRRPGTESVALIAGMAKALELWHRDQRERTTLLTSLRDRLERGLQQHCGPTVIIGGETARLPNTLNIAFPGLNGEALLVALDLAGVCASLGSTCASGSTEPAPILLAMGHPHDVAQSAVRLTLSVQNTTEEIEVAIERITRVVVQLRNYLDMK